MAAPARDQERARTLLILGASGDLTSRLLLPGLAELVAAGEAGDLALVGSATRDWDDAEWRARVADAAAAAGAEGPAIERLLERTRYVPADVTDPGDLRRLLEACEPPAVLYFALPPPVTEHACRALLDLGLPEGTRLALEKPFGSDAASAERLNGLLARLAPEERVFRIDHFLGLSGVGTLVGLRTPGGPLEPLLGAEHAERVEIVFDETLGLEGRARYYDRSGALADMLQSHLLQVLSLVAMEPPASPGPGALHEAQAHVLHATRVWEDDPVRSSRRGRYTAGTIGARRLPAYADEEGVDPRRETETFAEVVLAVDTARWAGVPFCLRSGKAIGDPRQEVAIAFRGRPDIPDALRGRRPDRLRLDLEPGARPEYAEVLRGVLTGDRTRTVRGDVAVQCWRIVEPVQASWRAGRPPLLDYPAGSQGPER